MVESGLLVEVSDHKGLRCPILLAPRLLHRPGLLNWGSESFKCIFSVLKVFLRIISGLVKIFLSLMIKKGGQGDLSTQKLNHYLKLLVLETG